MVSKVYDAKAEGLAAPGERFGEWVVTYSKDCLAPLRMRRHSDKGALMADYMVRCRRCAPCLRARTRFWTYHAVEQTRRTEAQGLRTWFGTLTLRPEAQRDTLNQACLAWMAEAPGSGVPDWWDDPTCDERFKLHRAVLVRELQLYFKRLRKAGHKFKYFVVFERHKSGLPHIHWLLHECGPEQITKTELQSQWKLGFTQVKLVGGYDKKRKRVLNPSYAAFYVSKYLSKSYQSRQLVSVGYKNKTR